MFTRSASSVFFQEFTTLNFDDGETEYGMQWLQSKLVTMFEEKKTDYNIYILVLQHANVM